MQVTLKIALESLLWVIYGVAFTWEDHGMQGNWCESMLMCYEEWLVLIS